SGGQTTNLLSHNIDIVEWTSGASPRRVSAMGSRYALGGIGETPDVVEALIEYPGFVVNWSSHEACASLRNTFDFLGTKGRLSIDRAGLEVVPDAMIEPEAQLPSFTEPRRPATGPPALRTEALKLSGFDQVRDQFVPHVRNFLDCVKSRKEPNSELASGHSTTTTCHLV